MKILVINTGSSSLKFKLFEMDSEQVLAAGLLEKIGKPDSKLTTQLQIEGELRHRTESAAIASHQEGLEWICHILDDSQLICSNNNDASCNDVASDDLFGVGHRVVHGGETFKEPTLIDDRVLRTIQAQTPLAPLHNPANILGIEVALQAFPQTPQIAVFDTAFHQTIPTVAYRYAIPDEWYREYQIRRYGFHGTSHQYVSRQAAEFLKRPVEELNQIVLHLGNGASMTAIRKGESVDTSMGLTPLEGLIMGTRSGDLDPAIIFHLANTANLSLQEIDNILNKQSGLKGICGHSDMREIVSGAKSGDDQAQLALEMVCYRIKKYLGAYFAILGEVDAIVFTAGIGENAPEVRELACQNLNSLGIKLDVEKNLVRSSQTRRIDHADSNVAILVIPTDEELEIARQTLTCLHNKEN